MSHSPEDFRIKICEKIQEYTELSENDTKNLEKGIYNYSLKEATRKKVVKRWDDANFNLIYKNRLRTILYNLRINNDLLEQIKNKVTKPHEIAFMTHQELQPKKWTRLLEEKSKKDKTLFETSLEAATDTHTCRKCKSKKCSYYLMQIRSADEPMTCFITCLDCGNRWKN